MMQRTRISFCKILRLLLLLVTTTIINMDDVILMIRKVNALEVITTTTKLRPVEVITTTTTSKLPPPFVVAYHDNNDVDNNNNNNSNDDNMKNVEIPSLITRTSSSRSTSSSSRTSTRSNSMNRYLTIGDFDTLNERWSDSLVITLNETVVTQQVAFQPLNIILSNIYCSNLYIGDIDWVWKQQEQLLLESNMTITDVSINCTLNYEWDYMFVADRGEASISTSDGFIATSFSLLIPPPESESSSNETAEVDKNDNQSNNFIFDINNCYADITINDLFFVGASPINLVLNVIQLFIQGYIENQIENQICTMITKLETTFGSILNNNNNIIPETNTTINDNNNNNNDDVDTNNNNFLEYEELMKQTLPKNIQLINFQSDPNDPSSNTSPIVKLLDQVSQFTGIDIFLDNEDNNVNTTTTPNDDNNQDSTTADEDDDDWLNSLFNLTEDGEYIIDLSKNEMFNGPDGIITKLTQKEENASSFLDDFFPPIPSTDGRTNDTESTSTTSASLLTKFFGVTNIRMMNATIIGLNEKSLPNILNGIEAIGDYTLQVGIHLQEMQIKMTLEVDKVPPSSSVILVENTTGTDQTNDRMMMESIYTELVTIQFNVTNLNFEAGVLVAIDEGILGSITLGSLLRSVRTIVPCLSSALYDKIQVTGIRILPLTIHSINIDGFESPGMERIITTAGEYGVAALQYTMDDIITNMIAGMDLSSFLGNSNKTTETNSAPTTSDIATTANTCPAPVEGTNGMYVDIRDLLLSPADAITYGGSGTEPYGNLTSGLRSQLRSIVSDYTNLTITREVFNYTNVIQIGKKKNEVLVKFILSNFRFQNKALDNQQGVLDPVRGEPFIVNNTFNLDKALLGGTIDFGLLLGKNNVSLAADVVFDIGSLNVMLTLLTKMIEDNFLDFPIQDAMNLNCWLALFPAPILDDIGMRTNESSFGLSILDFGINMQDLILNITCFECSPSFEKVANLISSRDYTNSMTLLLHDVLEVIFHNDPSIVQVLLDRFVTKAPQLCPHNPEYNSSRVQPTLYDSLIDALTVPDAFTVATGTDDTDATTLGLLVSVIIIFLLIVLGFILVRKMTKAVVARRFHQMVQTLPTEEVYALIAAQKEEDKKQEELNKYCGSLSTNDEIPKIIRLYVIPVMLLVSSVFFWSGLLSPSMSVMVFVDIFGEKVFSITDISYSLATLAGDWWRIGARSSAILTVLGFLWPQLKLFATLVLWYLPTSKVYVSTRGSALKWLDIFGKWSILSVFIVIISASVFHGEIATNIYKVTFLYVPTFGVYAIILGHILSVAASKIAIHYHNDIINSFEKVCDKKRRNLHEGIPVSSPSEDAFEIKVEQSYSNEPESRRCALRNLSFTRPHRGDSAKVKIRLCVQYGFVIICGLIILATVVGCVLPSFEYSISGLVGLVLNYSHSPGQTSNENSVFSIVSWLMDMAKVLEEGKHKIGLGSICCFLILTVLIIPVIETMTLLVQWLYPMEPRSQMKLKVTSDSLEAWQCMEVYFVAALSTALQLNGISNFFAETYCASLTGTFRSLVYFGMVEEYDAECIVVDSSIKVSTLAFFGATLALVLLRGFIKDALNHRIKQENNRLRVSKNNCGRSGESGETYDEWKEQIDQLRPTQDHFTDRFRWTLCSEYAVHWHGL